MAAVTLAMLSVTPIRADDIWYSVQKNDNPWVWKSSVRVITPIDGGTFSEGLINCHTEHNWRVTTLGQPGGIELRTFLADATLVRGIEVENDEVLWHIDVYPPSYPGDDSAYEWQPASAADHNHNYDFYAATWIVQAESELVTWREDTQLPSALVTHKHTIVVQ